MKKIIVLIAPLPYFIVFLAHYLNPPLGMLPTGFITNDMPFYSANAREIFESGNNILYANPYIYNSPPIYFHLFLWILGIGIKILSFEPGIQFITFGILSGFLLSWITYKIIEHLLPKKDFINFIFLLAMWGGGFLVIGQVINNAILGAPLTDDLLHFDPGVGYWFLNWGRNIIFTTESIYHCLFAATWLFLLKKRWGYALSFTALLAASHPYSGVQLLLIVIPYIYLISYLKLETISSFYRISFLMIFGLFVGYYFFFLPSFETHKLIQSGWAAAWILPWESLFLAYTLLFIFAVVALYQSKKTESSKNWLFIISFLVSIALAKHELLFTPYFPIHFTRGYIWMSLFLLSLPVIQHLFINIHKRFSKPVAYSLLTFIFLIFIVDNFNFINITRLNNKAGIFISPNQYAMYQWMDIQEINGILLTPEDKTFNYLAASYTEATPYLGHWMLVPDYDERDANVKSLIAGKPPGDWFNQIDYVILDEQKLMNYPALTRWEVIHQEGDLILLERP